MIYLWPAGVAVVESGGGGSRGIDSFSLACLISSTFEGGVGAGR